MTKYGAILLDPPWPFRTYSNRLVIPQRATLQHYKTMTAEQLAGLPVLDLAAPDCMLFLWCVSYQTQLAHDLVKLWGFKMKTLAFIWDKERMGMGYYTRQEGEICFLATRGKPRRQSRGVRQILHQKAREHSRKPDDFYSRIAALTEGPYLEMFARQRWPGWDQWGDQVDKFNMPLDND